MKKPENKYRKGSIACSLMEEDWADLTVPEIADVLVTSVDVIRAEMRRIKRETGYRVPYHALQRQEQKQEYPDGGTERLCEGQFPQRLRYLRKRKRVSQRVLSNLCGLSTNAIYLYESGKAIPHPGSLLAISDYFEVSTDYLLGLSDDPRRLQ